jgi:hypothetical protein
MGQEIIAHNSFDGLLLFGVFWAAGVWAETGESTAWAAMQKTTRAPDTVD